MRRIYRTKRKIIRKKTAHLEDQARIIQALLLFYRAIQEENHRLHSALATYRIKLDILRDKTDYQETGG